jgi:glycosyltransferase involved in cell wall biosynthesis
VAANDINILVIAPHYCWFIKNYIEAISKYVNKIHVFVHHNYLAEISNYIPLAGFVEVVRQFYIKDKLIDSEGKPDNVNIHLLSLLYLIPDGRNKRVSDKIARQYMSYIDKHRIKVDIIHAHFLYPQGDVAVKLGKKMNVPVIITAHGHDVYDMPFRDEKWNKKIKWILDNSDHVITVSEINRRILVDNLKIAGEKITIVPNGFDLCKFKPISKKDAREKLNLPEDKKIILNVANLYSIKGQSFLIKSIKSVIKERQDIFCAIIGGGDLRKKLEQLITELDLEDYVRLFGVKPYAELPLWMNAADIFVLPSINEGNPVVMFEALGVGLPFIGTKVGGIPEVIISENYGLLVEPSNPTDLAEKIIIALNKKWDNELIRKYAQQFSWDNISRQTLNIYQTVINNYTANQNMNDIYK